MNLTNVHAIHRENIGDMASSPLLYFPLSVQAERLNIDGGGIPRLNNVLFGGGGLFYFHQFDRIAEAATGVRIAWGIGNNSHHRHRLTFPTILTTFDLVGLRDWPNPYQWVPCSSCMHPVFDAGLQPSTPVVCYEHRERPLKLALPTLNNGVSTMDQAVRFIASGETVVTNTYHGCYWATLLGRRVVVPDAFSSRFYGLKHPPFIGDVAQGLKRAAAYPKALNECRAVNIAFATKVQKVLERAAAE